MADEDSNLSWRNRRRSGGSLIRILFPSIVLTMIAVFMAVQILQIVPNVGPNSLRARMNPLHLWREAAESLPLILLILVMMMGSVLAALRVGLRPLRLISEQAAAIGPATISQRLPLSSTPREIAPLVYAFNAALDRLEAGMRAQRDFSANAAHELRTPIATLRAQVESVLAPEERAVAIEEFERMGRLIGQLLALAEADNGADINAITFDLLALVRSVTKDMASGIVASGRNLSFDATDGKIPCLGSPGLIEVALRNLLENAARHTPVGSEIIVIVSPAGVVTVCDDGPGIPEALHDRLFRRFSKANPHGSGAGLGLSIVRQVLLIHDGNASSRQTPKGACFVLDFTIAVQRARGGAAAQRRSAIFAS